MSGFRNPKPIYRPPSVLDSFISMQAEEKCIQDEQNRVNAEAVFEADLRAHTALVAKNEQEVKIAKAKLEISNRLVDTANQQKIDADAKKKLLQSLKLLKVALQPCVFVRHLRQCKPALCQCSCAPPSSLAHVPQHLCQPVL